MVVTLIIAIKDEADLPSGHKRKKAGDIIAVCPENHIGGRITRKTHLLVKVDLGSEIIELTDAKKLMIPQFETGILWFPENEEVLKIIGKRRYQIPLNEIITKSQLLGKTIDMKKLLDPNIDYQPLEEITITFENIIWDKISNKKLDNNNLKAIKLIGK